MHRINVNVLGFTVTKEVPSTVEEYNALAPNRTNPVLEDATDTIIYRGTSPSIRDGLCEHLEKTYGIARQNSGTEDDPVWEREAVYVKRVIATLAKDRNQTEEAVRAEILPTVQSLADTAPFPVAATPRQSDGPAIGKRDLALAEQVTKDGKHEAVAARLGEILNRKVDASDVKSLARAIADDRRRRAEIVANEQKAALGV